MDLENELKKYGIITKMQVENIKKWLSTFYIYAANENMPKNKRYEYTVSNITRGKILAVEFGYGVQSEFRNFHYCVALHDSPKKNPKVTVVPITSKKHPHQIPIGYELADRLENIVRDYEHSHFWQPYRDLAKKYANFPDIQFTFPAVGSYGSVFPTCTAHIEKLKAQILAIQNNKLSPLITELDKILKSLILFDQFYKASPNLQKYSYLRVEDITTISKARIINPKNTNHPLYKLRLSNESLDKLDKEIIRRFTLSK
ncbi:hypothetical protein [Veillonella magna]|uniref:hypothetical protein n=1 Tax=Veillonella magna TaxID=464322 RepID=UPI0023F206D8|nr:hypothetical protein [Veillonella magna]